MIILLPVGKLAFRDSSTRASELVKLKILTTNYLAFKDTPAHHSQGGREVDTVRPLVRVDAVKKKGNIKPQSGSKKTDSNLM